MSKGITLLFTRPLAGQARGPQAMAGMGLANGDYRQAMPQWCTFIEYVSGVAMVGIVIRAIMTAG